MTDPDRPRAAALRDGLCLAFGTLTAVPVPPPSRVDRAAAGVAMALAPVAGLVPGLAAGAACLAAGRAGVPALAAAVLAVGAGALTTRGLHLDGLADTADGLAAAYDRDRALEVMKRGDTGPAGAATLVLVLLLQVAALAGALARHGAIAAVMGVVVGRAALPLACARGMPPARPGGLGAAVAGSVPRTAVLAVQVAVTGSCVAVLPGARLSAALAVLVATACVGLLLARTRRRLGGVTGDVLGACVETGTAACLVVLAATPLG